MYNTFTTNEGLWGPPDTKSQYKYSGIQRRANSHMGDEPANRTLKLAGKETLSFPKRQRFNENTEDTIKEMKNSQSNAKLNMSKMREFDTMSHASKKSLTKSELSKFFTDGKRKATDNVTERLS